MKKPKMLKYPRKPKANASTQVMENYLAKVKEIDKRNSANEADYKREKAKKEQLKKKVAAVGKPRR